MNDALLTRTTRVCANCQRIIRTWQGYETNGVWRCDPDTITSCKRLSNACKNDLGCERLGIKPSDIAHSDACWALIMEEREREAPE